MNYEKMKLSNLNGGAALDMFNEELKNVLKNIADDNTDDRPREINIKVKIKPAKNKASASTVIEVTSKLVGINAHTSFITIENDGKGINAYVSNVQENELEFSEEKIIKGENFGS